MVSVSNQEAPNGARIHQVVDRLMCLIQGIGYVHPLNT